MVELTRQEIETILSQKKIEQETVLNEADKEALISEYKHFLKQINHFWSTSNGRYRVEMNEFKKTKPEGYWKERGQSTAFACYKLGIINFFDKYDGKEEVFGIIARARVRGEFKGF